MECYNSITARCPRQLAFMVAMMFFVAGLYYRQQPR